LKKIRKSSPARLPAEKLVRSICRAMRKHHSANDKIRIVLEGLECKESIENTEK
jgi:transposase